jgi:hypothetical protein
LDAQHAEKPSDLRAEKPVAFRNRLAEAFAKCAQRAVPLRGKISKILKLMNK